MASLPAHAFSHAQNSDADTSPSIEGWIPASPLKILLLALRISWHLPLPGALRKALKLRTTRYFYMAALGWGKPI